MLDLTKKYETRNGEWEVVQIEYFPDAPRSKQLVALLQHKVSNTKTLETYYSTGRYLRDSDEMLDLVLVNKTVDVWVVVDAIGDYTTVESKESAKYWTEKYGGQYKKVTFEVEE